jgi:endonuclease-8
MPEGDTIYRTARTLQRALAGKRVTKFVSALAKLSVQAENAGVVGQELSEVSAHGKHLLMRFASGVTLRSHMRMSGSWHIYRVGERWQRPHSELRILIETADFQAVAFLVQEAELMQAGQLSQRVAALGPDVLAPQFDVHDAAARLQQAGARPLCDVLLDQRVLAGLGNVYKSELLFLARVHPERQALTLSAHEAQLLTERAAQLLRANVQDAQQGIVTYRGLRRTTGRADPGDRLWVYNRAGQPCRECGESIVMQRMGQHARSTYYCPRCQPLRQQVRAFGA